MKHNLIFITQGSPMGIKAILILFVLGLSISCKSQVKDESKNVYAIKANQIQMNDMFVSLLKKTKDDFVSKFKKDPSVILVEFNADNSFSIENRASLYSNNDEQLLLNDNFIGGSIIDSVVILVKKNEYNYHKDFLSVNDFNSSFNFRYDNNMDFCFGKYKIDKELPILIDSYCSFDVFTD